MTPQARIASAAASVAALLLLVGCSGGDNGTVNAASQTTTTAAASPTTTAASASGSTATTAAGAASAKKVSANNASIAELTAAFDAAGISNGARWAREVDEYRPYPSDPNLPKLRGELAKYNPGPGVVDQIVAALSLP